MFKKYFYFGIFLGIIFPCAIEGLGGTSDFEDCLLESKDHFLESVRTFIRKGCHDIQNTPEFSDSVSMEKVKKELEIYWDEIEESTRPGIQYLEGGDSSLVFELNALPGVLFKTLRNNRWILSDPENRIIRQYGNAQQIAQDLKKNCLDLLLLPANGLIFMGTTSCPVIVEEKANIQGDNEYQWNLYVYCYEHFEELPWLLEYFKELFRQVTLFICITGNYDITPNHIPLEKDGKGIVLVDIDTAYHGDVYYGLARLCNMASPKLYGTIIATAADYLKMQPNDLENKLTINFRRKHLGIDVIQNKEAAIPEIDAHRKWLATHGIVRGDERVVIRAEDLNIVDPLDKIILEVIVKRINRYIAGQKYNAKPLVAKRCLDFDRLEDATYDCEDELKALGLSGEYLASEVQANYYLKAEIRNTAKRYKCEHVVPSDYFRLEDRIKIFMRDVLSKSSEIFKIKCNGNGWPLEILV